jgi:CheY-like chemotaxis protein
MRVLLVSADEWLRDGWATMLRALGVEVEAFASAAPALARLRAEVEDSTLPQVDAVITNALLQSDGSVKEDVCVESLRNVTGARIVLVAFGSQSEAEELAWRAAGVDLIYGHITPFALLGPLAELGIAPSATALAARALKGPLRVLWIWDDDSYTTDCRQLLEACDFEVEVVRTAADAFDRLRKGAEDPRLPPIDLIITADARRVAGPRPPAPQTHYLRQLRALTSVPVILNTFHAYTPEEERAWLDAGAARVSLFVQPFDWIVELMFEPHV